MAAERGRSGASLRRKLAFGAITNLVLLSLLESSLALLGAAPRRPPEPPVEFVGAQFGGVFPLQWDDRLFWSLRPGAMIPDLRERLGPQGFRGAAFRDAKRAGTRRLLCLGDSSTFGIGVEGQDTYARRLQRWLDSGENGDWEVLNLGVPGYSAVQMLRLLEDRGPALSPDLVVIYAGAWNDYTPAVRMGDLEAAKRIDERRGALSRVGLLDRLRSYRLLRDTLASRSERPASSIAESYRDGWARAKERPDGPRLTPTEFEDTLVAILDRIAAVGALPVLVVPPAPRSTSDRFEDGEIYAERIRAVGHARGAPTFDARARLRETGLPDDVLFVDLIHPSRVGHLLLARGIRREICASSFPGLDPIPPSDLAPIQLDLKPLLASARTEAGDPLAPVPAETFDALDPVVLVVPSPSRIVFPPVDCTERQDLEVEMSFLTRPDANVREGPVGDGPAKEVGPVRFEIHGTGPSGERRLLHEADLTARDDSPWCPVAPAAVQLPVDLGSPVSLELSVRGAPSFAVWGRPRLLSAW